MTPSRAIRFAALALAASSAACSGEGGDAGGPQCGRLDVLVAMSDYTSSACGGFGADGTTTLALGVNLGKDPALASSRGRVFFLARDQETLFELDPRCGTPIAQMGLHRGTTGSSNPQDVAVGTDGTLWIPRFNVPKLTIYAPSGDVADELDLAPFDGDGNPQASSIRILDLPGGPKAFVTLQRLDDTDPMLRSRQASWLLRIDALTHAPEGHLELEGRNAFQTAAFGEALYLAVPGNFDDAAEESAGIERVDAATFTSRLLVKETDLGGSVTSMAIAQGCAAAIVADPVPTVNATSLVTFDPDTGQVFRPASNAWMSTQGYDLQGLAWKDGVLYVGDRRRAEKGYPVHAFERVGGGCELRARPGTVFLAQKPVAMRGVE